MDLSSQDEAEIKAWIARLGADDIKERDRATEKLRESIGKALPQLKVAANSKDPEVAARAKALIAGTRRLEELEKKLTDATAKAIGTQRATLAFDDLPGFELETVLGELSKMNVFVSESAKQTSLDLKAENASLTATLDRSLAASGLSYTIYFGTIVVTKKDEPFSPGAPSLVALCTEPATAKARTAVQRLSEEKYDIDLESLPLSDALKVIGALASLSIEADPKLQESPATIGIKGKQMPSLAVLGLVCHQAAATWKIDERGVVQLSPAVPKKVRKP